MKSGGIVIVASAFCMAFVSADCEIQAVSV
jgi:hypothetical protein